LYIQNNKEGQVKLLGSNITLTYQISLCGACKNKLRLENYGHACFILNDTIFGQENSPNAFGII